MKKKLNIILTFLPFVISLLVFVMLLILIPKTNLAIWLKLILIITSMIFSLFFSVFFHEFGHMLYGLFSGYKFLQFRLANVIIYRNKGLKIKWEKMQMGVLGQCMMIPPKKNKNKQTPFVLYNFGGLIHSYLLLIISVLLFIIIKNDVLRYLLIPLITIDLYFCISNSIYTKDGINDMCNFIKIKKEPRKLDSIMYQLEVSANLFLDKNYGAKISYPLYVSDTIDNITFPPVLFRFYYAMDHNDLNLAKKYIEIIDNKFYSIAYLPHKIIAIFELMYADLIIYDDLNKFKNHYRKINQSMKIIIERFKADLILNYELYEAIYKDNYELASQKLIELRDLDTFKGDSLSLNNRLDYLAKYLGLKSHN